MTTENIVFYIVIPLIAALIGGGLTLVGVLITIEKQNKYNKVSEVNKFKPYLKISKQSSIEIYSTENIHGIDFSEDVNLPIILHGAIIYRIQDFNLKCTSNADMILKYIVVDENKCKFINNGVVEHDTIVTISTTKTLGINSLVGIHSLKIIAVDMLGNSYSYDCEYDKNCSSNGEVTLSNNKGKFPISDVTYVIRAIGLPQIVK